MNQQNKYRGLETNAKYNLIPRRTVPENCLQEDLSRFFLVSFHSSDNIP